MLIIKDLTYNGNKYVIESIEDEQLLSKDYKYLLKYEGQPKEISALFSRYTYYVLVNDTSVTWDDIMGGMLSSRLGDYIEHERVYSDIEMK